MVSNWEPTHSLVEDAISGAEISPCLPALAVTRLPLCLQWGDGLAHSQLALLWYSLSPLFCEQAKAVLYVRAFHWKALSLSLFSLFLAILQFELLSHISSLRLSSGHSGLVLTLSTQPAPPCSTPAPWWQMQVSGLLLHRELQLSVYSFFFSSRLCCPLRFQNSPQTHR